MQRNKAEEAFFVFLVARKNTSIIGDVVLNHKMNADGIVCLIHVVTSAFINAASSQRLQIRVPFTL